MSSISALAHPVETHRLSGILYPADDLTHVDAFKALRHWREEGRVSGAAVAVANPESAPTVMDEADFGLMASLG